jgi:hypothetical protein
VTIISFYSFQINRFQRCSVRRHCNSAAFRPCAKDAYRAVMRRSARGIEIPIFFVMWSDGINSRHLCIVFASEIVGWLFKDAAIARTWVPDVM